MNGTSSRKRASKASIVGDERSGRWNSSACAAASHSIATTPAVLSSIVCRRRAANVAIDTWSSWFAEVGSESTLAGCASDLFSDASAAAVTCAIMKPEFSPPCSIKNAGNPDSTGSISIAVRRSDSAPISAIASARLSAANATGSAWKLPPESASIVSAKTSGLSDTPLASASRMVHAWSIWSRQAPITCGWQRRQYGSCTFSQCRCDWRSGLSCSHSR